MEAEGSNMYSQLRSKELEIQQEATLQSPTLVGACFVLPSASLNSMLLSIMTANPDAQAIYIFVYMSTLTHSVASVFILMHKRHIAF